MVLVAAMTGMTRTSIDQLDVTDLETENGQGNVTDLESAVQPADVAVVIETSGMLGEMTPAIGLDDIETALLIQGSQPDTMRVEIETPGFLVG